jgi:molecular chaperone HtpG
MDTGIVIGARVLDVLTTGMYPQSLVALREYIQNSYDAIRRAERSEILKPNFGEVAIAIDEAGREIVIRDNGIGIPSAEARSTLLSIGASKKRVGDDAGFRGIGRLAGLAYCNKLIFRTAYLDEPHETELTFDALGMRRFISATSRTTETEGAVDLINRITKHRLLDRTPGRPFFEVRLVNVDPKACDFLNRDIVRDYLKQVAPVDFNHQSFTLALSDVNPFLQKHGAKRCINLTIQREGHRVSAVLKPYRTFHKAGNKSDNRVEIRGIETFVDPSEPPRWIAWLSKADDLKGIIADDDVRGIPVLCSNRHRTIGCAT